MIIFPLWVIFPVFLIGMYSNIVSALQAQNIWDGETREEKEKTV